MSATIAYRPDIDGLRTIAVGSVVACAADRALTDRQHDEADRMLDALAAADPAIRLVDPRAYLCNARACSALSDGTVMFADDGHLSPLGSAALAAPMTPTLDAAIFRPRPAIKGAAQ